MKFKELLEEGQTLFKKKHPVICLWQDIAENFYPERANFTAFHTYGQDFASHLYSSYPLLARRELGDSFSVMSRPQGQEWFYMALIDEDQEDRASKEWMEHKTGILRRIMYTPSSRFVRSMKEGDHDWCTFGQCALSVELNRNRDGILYRSWHLRDMAWTEGYAGEIDHFYRQWRPTNAQLLQYFGKDKLHESCRDEKKRGEETKCMHIFVPGYRYGHNTPYVSLYIDCDHEHLIEAVPYYYGYYVVPRWATVSDSQYAYSPAIICGLPDARLYQDMTRVLLEAGQKAVDPPLVAVRESLKSDVDLQPGGITAVSAANDRRLSDVISPLFVDKTGLGFGIELTDRVQMALAKALYLDKLNLPRGQDMTAYEAGIRFQEYVRTILPVFEPKEVEMEAKVCQLSFDIAFRHGAFGSVRDMPENMQGAPYQFKFVSPLSKAIEEKNTNTFHEVVRVLTEAASIDPISISNININQAVRDAVVGAGADADWLNDEDDVAVTQNQIRQQQAAQQQLALTQQAKDVITP
jgi:hypothetical protein